MIEYIKSLSGAADTGEYRGQPLGPATQPTSDQPTIQNPPSSNNRNATMIQVPRNELMATITFIPEITEEVTYLNQRNTIASWLLTRDHKRIAILYMISITCFFFVGGAAAVLCASSSSPPHSTLVEAETYNKLFTLHGIVMVFFFLVPSIPATLGNFLVPLMIGARDLAFPRLNLLSWYLFIIGGPSPSSPSSSAVSIPAGPSTLPYSTTFANTHVILAITGIFIAGFSSILTGLNFIVTIHKHALPRA